MQTAKTNGISVIHRYYKWYFIDDFLGSVFTVLGCGMLWQSVMCRGYRGGIPLPNRNSYHMKLVTSPMKFPNHIYIFITLHHYVLFLLLKVLEVGCRPPHPSTSGSR